MDEEAKKKEDTVLRTIPAKNEQSKLGETITIVIPEVEYKYPDFTKGYTIDQIDEFAEKHELKLEYKYQTTENVEEGTILKQSRAAKSVVTPGATLVITVAINPEVEEELPGETTEEIPETGE